MVASLKQVGTFNTPEGVLNRIQSEIASKVNAALALPILNGNLIAGVKLKASGPVKVAHGLGRAPLGWIVVDAPAAVQVWRSGTSDRLVLPLSTSADVTVSLWVF